MTRIDIITLPAKYSSLTGRQRAIVRRQYIEIQKNKCMYCGGELDGEPPTWITDKHIDWDLFPPDFLRYPIHLQHNHATDMTEGVVHAYCNAVMWQYERR